MPLREYLCQSCDTVTERFFRQSVRVRYEIQCPCGKKAELIVSVPAVLTWNGDRRFPNLSVGGDGTMSFPSEKAYKDHLKKLRLYEDCARGSKSIVRPHTARVYGGRKAKPSGRSGSAPGQ